MSEDATTTDAADGQDGASTESSPPAKKSTAKKSTAKRKRSGGKRKAKAPTVGTFVYNGPQARIVALDMDVHDGDVVHGPAELELAYGFRKATAAQAKKAVNDRAEVQAAVDAGVVGGSGEQTEDDR